MDTVRNRIIEKIYAFQNGLGSFSRLTGSNPTLIRPVISGYPITMAAMISHAPIMIKIIVSGPVIRRPWGYV